VKLLLLFPRARGLCKEFRSAEARSLAARGVRSAKQLCLSSCRFSTRQCPA